MNINSDIDRTAVLRASKKVNKSQSITETGQSPSINRRGKSIKGINNVIKDPEIERYRATSNLLPMVMDAMVYGPMIPKKRSYMKVLVVNMHEDILRYFSEYLTLKGCEVLSLADGAMASDVLTIEDFDIAFISLGELGNTDGIALIRSFAETVRKESPNNNKRNAVKSFDSESTPEAYSNHFVEEPENFAYNENMLLVGMDYTGSSKIEEARMNGMHVFCPLPIDATFVARIVQIWRSCATMHEGLEEISHHAARVVENINYSSKSVKKSASSKNQSNKDKGGSFSILDSMLTCCGFNVSPKIYSSTK